LVVAGAHLTCGGGGGDTEHRAQRRFDHVQGLWQAPAEGHQEGRGLPHQALGGALAGQDQVQGRRRQGHLAPHAALRRLVRRFHARLHRTRPFISPPHQPLPFRGGGGGPHASARSSPTPLADRPWCVVCVVCVSPQPEFYKVCHTKQQYDEVGPSICRHNPVFGAMTM
jgi:hypothetical protein